MVIISGRERKVLDKWFGNLPVDLVAEHGLFWKEKGKKWLMLKPIRRGWVKKNNPLLNRYAEKLPELRFY